MKYNLFIVCLPLEDNLFLKISSMIDLILNIIVFMLILELQGTFLELPYIYNLLIMILSFLIILKIPFIWKISAIIRLIVGIYSLNFIIMLVKYFFEELQKYKNIEIELESFMELSSIMMTIMVLIWLLYINCINFIIGLSVKKKDKKILSLNENYIRYNYGQNNHNKNYYEYQKYNLVNCQNLDCNCLKFN